LIPEIIGRLPVLTHMDPLERNIVCNFNNLKNALIKQYEKLFLLMDEVTFTITDEALKISLLIKR
jgi:ATP-dependent Clp protease ATP-binding subunit ClpX